MTAFLALRKATSIDLLTDGAAYRDDGTTVAIIMKVIELPKASAAVTLRGFLNVLPKLADVLSEFDSFDQMIDAIPQVLDAGRKHCANPSCVPWELLFVGISDAGHPKVVHVPSHHQNIDLIDEEYFSAGPQPTADTFAAAGYVPIQNVASFDPISHGVPIMQAMRMTPSRLRDDGPELFGVGGFIAHTKIERGVVTTRLIHLWPDELGRKIDPLRKGFPPHAFAPLIAETHP